MTILFIQLNYSYIYQKDQISQSNTNINLQNNGSIYLFYHIINLMTIRTILILVLCLILTSTIDVGEDNTHIIKPTQRAGRTKHKTNKLNATTKNNINTNTAFDAKSSLRLQQTQGSASSQIQIPAQIKKQANLMESPNHKQSQNQENTKINEQQHQNQQTQKIKQQKQTYINKNQESTKLIQKSIEPLNKLRQTASSKNQQKVSALKQDNNQQEKDKSVLKPQIPLENGVVKQIQAGDSQKQKILDKDSIGLSNKTKSGKKSKSHNKTKNKKHAKTAQDKQENKQANSIADKNTSVAIENPDKANQIITVQPVLSTQKSKSETTQNKQESVENRPEPKQNNLQITQVKQKQKNVQNQVELYQQLPEPKQINITENQKKQIQEQQLSLQQLTEISAPLTVVETSKQTQQIQNVDPVLKSEGQKQKQVPQIQTSVAPVLSQSKQGNQLMKNKAKVIALKDIQQAVNSQKQSKTTEKQNIIKSKSQQLKIQENININKAKSDQLIEKIQLGTNKSELNATLQQKFNQTNSKSQSQLTIEKQVKQIKQIPPVLSQNIKKDLQKTGNLHLDQQLSAKNKNQQQNAQQQINATKTQEETNATKTQEETNATKTQEETNATKTQEETNATKDKEETNVTKDKEEANTSNDKEETKDNKIQEGTNATKIQKETNTSNDNEEAKGNKIQEGTNATKTQEEANVTQDKEETNATKTQEEANVRKDKEKTNETKDKAEQLASKMQIVDNIISEGTLISKQGQNNATQVKQQIKNQKINANAVISQNKEKETKIQQTAVINTSNQLNAQINKNDSSILNQTNSNNQLKNNTIAVQKSKTGSFLQKQLNILISDKPNHQQQPKSQLQKPKSQLQQPKSQLQNKQSAKMQQTAKSAIIQYKIQENKNKQKVNIVDSTIQNKNNETKNILQQTAKPLNSATITEKSETAKQTEASFSQINNNSIIIKQATHSEQDEQKLINSTNQTENMVKNEPIASLTKSAKTQVPEKLSSIEKIEQINKNILSPYKKQTSGIQSALIQANKKGSTDVKETSSLSHVKQNIIVTKHNQVTTALSEATLSKIDQSLPKTVQSKTKQQIISNEIVNNKQKTPQQVNANNKIQIKIPVQISSVKHQFIASQVKSQSPLIQNTIQTNNKLQNPAKQQSSIMPKNNINKPEGRPENSFSKSRLSKNSIKSQLEQQRPKENKLEKQQKEIDDGIKKTFQQIKQKREATKNKLKAMQSKPQQQIQQATHQKVILQPKQPIEQTDYKTIFIIVLLAIIILIPLYRLLRWQKSSNVQSRRMDNDQDEANLDNQSGVEVAERLDDD